MPSFQETVRSGLRGGENTAAALKEDRRPSPKRRVSPSAERSHKMSGSRLASRGATSRGPRPVGGNSIQGIAKGAMRAVTQPEACFRFISALARLQDCDNSPLQRFKREFYADWNAAFSNPESRYIGPGKRAEMERNARAVLERWAAACNLLTASGSPPLWLIGHIDFLLLPAARPIVSKAAESPATGLSAAATSSLVAGSGGEEVHAPLLPIVASRRGEAWPKFKARILPLLESGWEAEQRAYRNQKVVTPLK